MRFLKFLFLYATIIVLITCNSTPLIISKAPKESYTKLGQTSGSACGYLFVISTAYNFIPIVLNSRVDRAYNEALMKFPEATSLIEVTIREDWYWFVLGTAKCTTISGVAIK